MNRALQYFNALGVAVLAALCLIQWQANRRVNLEAVGLEKTRLEQTTKLDEQDKTLKGIAADLDSFREQLSRATGGLKDAEKRIVVIERENHQLTTEREQLKVSVTNWAAAVTLRDERLKEASEQMQKIAADRNEAVVKFNALAKKHSETVTTLNERTKQFNELVTQFKAIKQPQQQLERESIALSP